MMPIARRLATGFISIAALPRSLKQLTVALEVDAHGGMATLGLTDAEHVHLELDHFGRQDMRHAKLARREAYALSGVSNEKRALSGEHTEEETRLSPVAQMILDMNNKMNSMTPPPGACNTVRANAKHRAEAKCESPTKATGCSCETTLTPGCGTHFTGEDQCAATTTADVNVSVIIRCCHIDWAHGWEAVYGTPSDAGQTDSTATCTGSKTATGCTCHPVTDGEKCLSFGINTANIKECKATGYQGNTGGVRAVARCASFVNQPDDYFKSVEVAETSLPVMEEGNPKSKMTVAHCANNGSDGGTKDQMISCHCSGAIIGDAPQQCMGGSIVAQKCMCWGPACVSNAICGHIPAPKQDCAWADWAEWGPCSKTCGNGTVSRARELASPAYNGGEMCVGSLEQNQSCEEDVPEVCEPHHNHKTTYIIIGVALAVVVILGIAIAVYVTQHKGKGHAYEAEGEGEWGADYGEGEGTEGG